MVVTGTRTAKRLSDSPVQTVVVSARELERAAAISTLEGLQDNIPGLTVTPNEMGNNLRIKGLNSRYILLLVDGERLVGEGANGNVNLDQVDVGTVRQIEVVDGAASALYGSSAVGAVINIITKEPGDGFEAGLNPSWESPGTWRTRLDVGAGTGAASKSETKKGTKNAVQKSFSARGGAFRNSSEGFGERGNEPYAARYEDWGANLKLAAKPTKRTNLGLTGRWFRHETFNPAGSMNTAHQMTDNLTVGAHGGFDTAVNKLTFSVNFDKYFDNQVLERLDNRRALQNTATYLSARAIDTYAPNARWELVAGAEYDHEENYALTTLGGNQTTKSVDEGSLFAQAEWKPTAGFDIIAGARYTHDSQFGSALSPKLSVMYSAGGWRFRGGIGTAFRAPSIKELYYDFDHQGMFWIYGNPDLKPERGVYSSLGTEYVNGAANLSLSGYVNRIKDKITRYDVVSNQGKLDKHYRNVSHATLRGVDMSAAYTFWGQLALRGSYGFCDAVDGATGAQLDGNVKHSATVAATWNGFLRRGGRGAFSLQLAGRMSSPFSYYTELGTRVESRAYNIWKAVLTKPFDLGRGHTLDVQFKVDNLFGFRDVAFIDPGRRFLIGLKYNFR